MKTSSVQGTGSHAASIILGWRTPAAVSEGPPPFDLENDSGGALAEGDVVIVKSNGKLGTTTTANYTGFVGVCIDDIDAGDTGPVQFFGPVDQVNTTGAVTAGNYLITSTTTKKATQSTNRTAGTFGLITSTTTNPSAFLDGGLPDFGVDTVPSSFAFTGVISPAQLTANTDDWNPTGLATAVIIRASTDASRNLTGLQGGSSGRVIILHNVGSFDLVLKHDVTSTAANRFYCLSSADVTLSANGTALLVYDATSSRWRVFSGGGGGSSLTVKDESSNLDTAVTSIDFVGGGVTATNVGHAITVTIPTASAGNSSSADSSGDVTVTGSLQDVTGCSVSLVAGTWIVTGVFDVLVNNALNDRTFEGHLDSGGSDQTLIAPVVAGTLANDRWNAVQQWRLTLGSTTTVKLRCKYTGGTNGDFTVKANSRIVAVMPAGLTDPMTTRGDMIYRNASNVTDRLAIPATGQVIGRSGSDLGAIYPPGYELDYATISTLVSVTGTSEGGANTVIASNSVSYDGSTVVFVEFFAPRLSAGPSGSVVLDLYVDSTIQGRIGVITSPAGNASASPCFVKSPKITPSNGSHTFTIKAWRGTADGEVTVGSGGTGAYLNGYIRVVKV